MCNFACKGCPRNDLYCVGWDIKPYTLTRSVHVSQLALEIVTVRTEWACLCIMCDFVLMSLQVCLSVCLYSANDGCLYVYDRQRNERTLRVCFSSFSLFLISRVHSFPWVAEFWAKPWNLPFSAEFWYFHGSSWNFAKTEKWPMISTIVGFIM